jgi:hypothetical protein
MKSIRNLLTINFLFLIMILSLSNNNFLVNESKILMGSDLKSDLKPVLSESRNYTGSLINPRQYSLKDVHYNVTNEDMSMSDNILDVITSDSIDFRNLNISLSINNIQSNNLTVDYDPTGLTTATNDANYVALDVAYLAGSFTIPMNCYLQNISIFGNSQLGDGTMYFEIYNASWDGSYHKPDALYESITQTAAFPGSAANWIGVKYINALLNNSKTLNNTWFLRMNTDGFPYYIGRTAATNLADCWQYPDGGPWTYRNVDYAYNLSFSPYFISPTPSEIGLQVNTSSVTDMGGNEGLYTLNQILNENVPSLKFNFTSNWPAASWRLEKINANYSTDLIDVYPTYNVGNNQDVYWNVTFITNKFTNAIDNHTIALNVPNGWDLIDYTYELSSQVSDYINITFDSPNKIITVGTPLSDNGKWSFLFKSANIIDILKTQIGTFDKDTFVWDEDINISAVVDISIQISGVVNLTIYDPFGSQFYSDVFPVTNKNVFDLFVWDLSANVVDFGPYMITASWNNDTDAFYIEKNITIVSKTSVNLIGILDQSELFNSVSESFYVIAWNWTNIQNGNNYTDARVEYKVPGTVNTWNTTDYTDGLFKIFINASELATGNYIIPINMSRTFTDNLTFNFQFSVVEGTNAVKNDAASQLEVMRGRNATYAVAYNTSTPNQSIETAVIQPISVSNAFTYSTSYSAGLYYIAFNTSAANVGNYPVSFNISRVGYETRVLNFALTITAAATNITILDWTKDIMRKDDANITVDFRFDDIALTGTPKPISGANLSQFDVKFAGNDTLWGLPWSVTALANPGEYRLTMKTTAMNAMSYAIKIGGQFSDNYLYSQSPAISFTILGNTTQLVLAEMSYGVQLPITPVSGNYTIYQDTLPYINFLFQDLNQGTRNIPDGGITVKYLWLDNTPITGVSFTYASTTGEFRGQIDLTGVPVGYHNLTVTFAQLNYANGTLVIPLNIIAKMQVNISLVSVSESIVAGQSFTIILNVTYYNSTVDEWLPFVGKSVTLTTVPATLTVTNQSDAEGLLRFDLTIPANFDVTKTLNVTITFPGEYNFGVFALPLDPITVTSPPPPESLFPPWLIYVLALGLVMAIALPVYQKKVVAPRKQRYEELVMSSSTVFDDAINLKHILIIFKSTGTCIFFKSFGEETIDPDLISGFLSAVQSFGKEIKAQKSLNELAYGDNVLLFSDGEMIRVTLVLGKGSSPFMKKNLAEFVGKFEAKNQRKLASWKGSLNAFRDSDELIDDVLNTSVILPHELSSDKNLLKKVKSSMAKDLLKMAKELVTEERNFIFLAQLMANAREVMKKDAAEIILGLNELRELQILKPIRIEKLTETPQLSEAEMQELANRVAAIEGKSMEEKQELILQLKDMPANEREAILSSLSHSVKITTSLTGETIETQKFENVKAVKAEIKKLEKEAKTALKENRYDEAIRKYEIAEINAYQWNLDLEGKRLGSLVLRNTVTKYRTIIKNSRKDAAKAEKGGKFDEAKVKYEEALGAAHELFKLGFPEMEEETRELNKKILECGKRSGAVAEYKVLITKENLFASEKVALKDLKAGEKAKDLLKQLEAATKLVVIANSLFQFGIIEKSDDVKHYKVKLDEIKKAMTEQSEEKVAEFAAVFNDLNEKKPQVLDFGKNSEDQQDWVNAIVAYQQVMMVYLKTGDSENALALINKISDVLQKIPDINAEIKKYYQEHEKLKAAGDTDGATLQLQYAQALEDALFKPHKK